MTSLLHETRSFFCLKVTSVKSLSELLPVSFAMPEGTLVFLIQEQLLLLRVKDGWIKITVIQPINI